MPWDDLFVSLENGEIDLAISSITITDERREKMLFSIPYYEGGQMIVYNENHSEVSTHIVSHDDLEIAGAQAGTTGETEARKMFSEVLVYDSVDVYDSEQGIIHDILTNKINHLVIDKVVAIQLISVYQDKLFLNNELLTVESYGVATKLNNEKLIDLVNVVISEQD